MTAQTTSPAPARKIGLTARQTECLAFIRAYSSAHGICPSYAEIRTALNYGSTSIVHYLISGLEGRGAIRKLPRKARAITVVERSCPKCGHHLLAEGP